MFTIRMCLLLSLAGCAFAAEPNALSSQEKSQGWALLFDGNSMKGWEDPAKRNPPSDAFSVDDGTLHAHPRPKVRADLFTLQKFRDFEVVFDWKVARHSNTGFKYRVQDRFLIESRSSDPALQRFENLANYRMTHRLKTPPEHGEEYSVAFEFQVIDNAAFKPGEGLLQRAGSLSDMIAASRDTTRPVGEWNHSRIVVKGKHVEHWLNGARVVAGSLDSRQVKNGIIHRWGANSPIGKALLNARPEGALVLQNHDNEAWFRSIKVRRL
ncbi:MAG: DUF1080 domain-containing protein [Acidobacteria bacterium]|nr:DUF1080 domain-containing protein [Acidobacteriota bacterium]